jgi:hypothetical protein
MPEHELFSDIFPFVLKPDNNNHMQFYGASCSSELPFTAKLLHEVKIVLLFNLKFCIRNHDMKYLYTQNLWKFSFNVRNRGNNCLLKFLDDKGATPRLLKELNVGF